MHDYIIMYHNIPVIKFNGTMNAKVFRCDNGRGGVKAGVIIIVSRVASRAMQHVTR